jgi:hypothetical protein
VSVVKRRLRVAVWRHVKDAARKDSQTEIGKPQGNRSGLILYGAIYFVCRAAVANAAFDMSSG